MTTTKFQLWTEPKTSDGYPVQIKEFHLIRTVELSEPCEGITVKDFLYAANEYAINLWGKSGEIHIHGHDKSSEQLPKFTCMAEFQRSYRIGAGEGDGISSGSRIRLIWFVDSISGSIGDLSNLVLSGINWEQDAENWYA